MALPTLHAATGTLTSGLITTLTISRAARMVSKRLAHANVPIIDTVPVFLNGILELSFASVNKRALSIKSYILISQMEYNGFS